MQCIKSGTLKILNCFPHNRSQHNDWNKCSISFMVVMYSNVKQTTISLRCKMHFMGINYTESELFRSFIQWALLMLVFICNAFAIFVYFFSIGFSGELCNYEYNECDSNPCLNDGQCTDHIGGFSCKCTRGYTGKRCHIKVSIFFSLSQHSGWIFFIPSQCWLWLSILFEFGAWMFLFCNHFIYILCFISDDTLSFPILLSFDVLIFLISIFFVYKFPNAIHKIKCEIDVVMLQFFKSAEHSALQQSKKWQIVLDVFPNANLRTRINE